MRLALRVALCAASSTVAAASPAAEAPTAAHHETVELARGVFAYLPEVSSTGIVSGNTLVVAGDDAVLVFDAGNFPSAARAIVADIARRTGGKPIRYLVNSHWHFDHTLANGTYRTLVPGLAIVAHDFTREKMAGNFEAFGKGAGEFYAADAPRIRERLVSGLRRDGTPLSAADRGILAARLREEVAVAPEYAEATLALPDVTFGSELVVHLGGRDVRLLHLGRGNTAGDVMAYVPDAGVVASGDVLVLPTPFGYGSYPTEWIAVLDKLRGLGARVIVPGHGPVQRDDGYVRTLASLLGSITAQAVALRGQGLSKPDVRKAIDVAGFRRQLAGDDPGRIEAFDSFFLDPVVERACQEIEGALAPE